MGTLDGKGALVTGGSRGIGRAIVKRLARDGASVLFSYLSDEAAAQSVVAEVTGAGGRAASRAVISTSAIEAASVSMCAASEINASECAARPATTSPAMKAKISASAAESHLASAPGAGPCACRCVAATI